jgi:UDP-N-acetylmuramoyl-tripeptide--D-alanyl-D-alanine ligase
VLKTGGFVKLEFRKIRKDLGWALRRLQARWVRARNKATFIGITGSSGKSTSTSLLAHLLGAQGKVHLQA